MTDSWHQMMVAAVDRIQQAFTNLELGPAPPYVKAHAETLAAEHESIEDDQCASEGYAIAFAFGARPINELGLGMDVRLAH